MERYNDTYNEEDEAYEDEVEAHQDEVGSLEQNSDELLVDIIKGYPHLYNTALKDYKDTNMKQNSWTEISKTMDMPVIDCQNRWSRLRDAFSKERRLQELETRSGSGASQRRGFQLYEKLSFSKNHVKRRRSYTNVNKESAKKQLLHSNISPLCNNININTSITPPTETVVNIEPNTSFPNTSFQIPSNYSKENTQQIPHVITTDRNRQFSPLLVSESHSSSGISGTSTPEITASSPTLLMPSANRKLGRPKNPNAYLEHTLTSLSNTLQKRVANPPVNAPSPDTSWNLNNLTPEKTFGILVAKELEKMSEPERSKRKLMLAEILLKPL